MVYRVSNTFANPFPCQGIQPFSPPRISSTDFDLTIYRPTISIISSMAIWHRLFHTMVFACSTLTMRNLLKSESPQNRVTLQPRTKIIDDLVMITQFDGYCEVIVWNCLHNTRHIRSLPSAVWFENPWSFNFATSLCYGY